MSKNTIIQMFQRRTLVAVVLILCGIQLTSCEFSTVGNQIPIQNESTADIISEQMPESESVAADTLISLEIPKVESNVQTEPGVTEETESNIETELEDSEKTDEIKREDESDSDQYIGRIAFTFDDGPTVSVMEKILDKCEESGAKVTFFVCGYKIGQNCHAVMQRAIELGCEIGNHSTNHPNFYKLSEEEIKSEIDTTNRLIKEAAGIDATLMRPPYGNLTKEIAIKLDMQFILWSVDPEDWKYRDTQTVYNNVINHVNDGDIVLLHDIYQTSYEAFCLLVDTLQEEGYQLVTVSELMEESGMSLVNGYFYYNSTYAK